MAEIVPKLLAPTGDRRQRFLAYGDPLLNKWLSPWPKTPSHSVFFCSCENQCLPVEYGIKGNESILREINLFSHL